MKVAAIISALWVFLLATSSAIFLPQNGLLSVFKAQIVDVPTVQDVLENFWDKARRVGPKAGHIVLDEIVKVNTETGRIVNDLKIAMAGVVEEVQKMREELQTIIERRNITIEHLSDVLSDEIGKAYLELKEEIIDSLPQNRSERAKVRADSIGKILQKVDSAYNQAMVKLGVPSEQAEQQFQRLSPKIIHVLLVTGNIIDDHPYLLELVIFAASMLLLPEIQILRPVMSVFGFGPLGPIKGSTAAWLQSKLWGGFVRSGSWFSILQKVAMTLTGSWIQKVIASAGLAAALGLVTGKVFGACF